MSHKNISINYAILAIPLAFVGLPIYINVSDFYIRYFEVNIAYLAFIILAVRLIDTIQEPLLGLFSDYLNKRNISYHKIIYYSGFFLGLSFFGLFNPPSFLAGNLVLLWLAGSMIATYSFFNLAVINFESLGVIIAKDSAQRITINSHKELCGLIGILIASATPTLLRYVTNNDQHNYFYLSVVFVFLLFGAIVLFFRRLEVSKPSTPQIHFQSLVKTQIFSTILRNKIFMKLMLIIFLNATAVSLPASVITYFVNDILQAGDKLGIFLVIYFLSAGVFMNFWRFIAKRFGKVNCWYLSIIGSVITFICAFFVDSSNYQLFYLICFASGIFLGADLMMPPILIADIIQNKSGMISSYISSWSMINKLGLALASFASLAILSLVNYDPKILNSASTLVIPILYTILPCILKLSVFILLIKDQNLKKL